MNLFQIFSRKTSAPVARERLQILLAHERSATGDPDLVAQLQKAVLAAVSKHIAVDPDKVEVKLHRQATVSLLEIDIEIEAAAINQAGKAA